VKSCKGFWIAHRCVPAPIARDLVGYGYVFVYPFHWKPTWLLGVVVKGGPSDSKPKKNQSVRAEYVRSKKNVEPSVQNATESNEFTLGAV
jgi:hypothetical protein